MKRREDESDETCTFITFPSYTRILQESHSSKERRALKQKKIKKLDLRR